MDWETHVVLAAKLLKSCDLDKGAAIYSNLPVIDNKPAHYHRVYAHILENQPSILDVALEIFGSEEIASRNFNALARRMTAKNDNLKKDLERASGYEERSELDVYVIWDRTSSKVCSSESRHKHFRIFIHREVKSHGVQR